MNGKSHTVTEWRVCLQGWVEEKNHLFNQPAFKLETWCGVKWETPIMKCISLLWLFRDSVNHTIERKSLSQRPKTLKHVWSWSPSSPLRFLSLEENPLDSWWCCGRWLCLWGTPQKETHSTDRQAEVPTAIDYDSNPEVTENREIITTVSSVSPRPPPQPSTDTIKSWQKADIERHLRHYSVAWKDLVLNATLILHIQGCMHGVIVTMQRCGHERMMGQEYTKRE